MANDLDVFMATMVGQPVLVSPETVQKVVRDFYGLHVTAQRLTGERDENFKLAAADGAEYVFKVANTAEEPAITDVAIAALLHLEAADPGFPCPRVCRSLDGHTQIRFQDSNGLSRLARLLTYLPGVQLRSSSHSAEQRAACGRIAARLGRSLRHFEHPASHRPFIWDIRNLPKMRLLLAELPHFSPAPFIADFITRYEAEAEGHLMAVRRQVLHNDMNGLNILVEAGDHTRIAGIIDFGDMVHTAVIADVAIAASAQLTDGASVKDAVTDLAAAYHDVEPLTDTEVRILNWLVAARVVMDIVIPSWHKLRNPRSGHYDRVDATYIQKRLVIVEALMPMRIVLP